MKILGYLLGAVLFWFVGPLIVTSIIGYLFTPDFLFKVFGVYAFTYWKSFWLIWLCSVLFKAYSFQNKD